jgi:hypothetical protein
MISAARPKSTRVAKTHNSPAVAKSRVLVIRILRMVIAPGYRPGREENLSKAKISKLHSLLDSDRASSYRISATVSTDGRAKPEEARGSRHCTLVLRLLADVGPQKNLDEIAYRNSWLDHQVRMDHDPR